MSTASSFSSYATQIETSTSSIRTFLSQPLESRTVPGLVTAQSQLDECTSCLAGMEGAAEEASQGNKKALKSKADRMRKDVQALEEELKRESVR